jgi:hypothetical protein
MRDLMAESTGMRLPEFEGEYFGGVVADRTDAALPRLADLTLVEVLGQDGELSLDGRLLVPVVDVVQVLEAEQVALEAVVEPSAKHAVHQLGVADGVVHQVQLSAQDEEVIQAAVALHHGLLVADFDDGLLEVALDAFVA